MADSFSVKGFSPAVVTPFEARVWLPEERGIRNGSKRRRQKKTMKKQSNLFLSSFVLMASWLGGIASAQPTASYHPIGVYRFPFPPGAALAGQAELNGLTWANQLGVAATGESSMYLDDGDLFRPSDTVFVVASYTFNPGADNDLARMWINP